MSEREGIPVSWTQEKSLDKVHIRGEWARSVFTIKLFLTIKVLLITLTITLTIIITFTIKVLIIKFLLTIKFSSSPLQTCKR